MASTRCGPGTERRCRRRLFDHACRSVEKLPLQHYLRRRESAAEQVRPEDGDLTGSSPGQGCLKASSAWTPSRRSGSLCVLGSAPGPTLDRVAEPVAVAAGE